MVYSVFSVYTGPCWVKLFPVVDCDLPQKQQDAKEFGWLTAQVMILKLDSFHGNTRIIFFAASEPRFLTIKQNLIALVTESGCLFTS